MSWHLVDGVPLPDPVAGHPALDFCNTRAGWGTPTPKEYLSGPRALRLWVAEAGLSVTTVAAEAGTATDTDGDLDGDLDDHAGRRALQRALRLREALYGAALGRADGADWELLSLEAAAARAAARLEPGPDGARWRLRSGPGRLGAAHDPTLLALHAVAAIAEELLVSPLAGCVAACPGVGCGWLFADPRRRRRWCSMAVCGNRAKARRFAARSDRSPGADGSPGPDRSPGTGHESPAR
jgi:predicted RNA-binding Zn ribbon-like protein